MTSLFRSPPFFFVRMWTCLLFKIFKRCNIPMVAMGTVRHFIFTFYLVLSRKMELWICSKSHFCLWAVPHRPCLDHWEEKQADWDITLLPCSCNWELFYMHDWCRVFVTFGEFEKSWCGNFQLINSHHNALLCRGEGSVSVKILECAWLGVWHSPSTLWNTPLQK